MRRHERLEGRPPAAAVLGPDRGSERLHPEAPASAAVTADRAQAGEPRAPPVRGDPDPVDPFAHAHAHAPAFR